MDDRTRPAVLDDAQAELTRLRDWLATTDSLALADAEQRVRAIVLAIGGRLLAARPDAVPQQRGVGGLEAGVAATVRATVVAASDEFSFGDQQIFRCLRQKKDRILIHAGDCISQLQDGSR